MQSKSKAILFIFIQCLFLQNVFSFAPSSFHSSTSSTASFPSSSSTSSFFTTNTNTINLSPPLTTTTLYGKKAARALGNDRKNKKERVKKVKDDVIEVEATVIESLPNAMFRCKIDGVADTTPPILATISGKIRKFYVKILVGDSVTIELSPYDLTRGRITFRKR